MFEIHPSNWPMATGTVDPRDTFHLTALREAQAATEFRGNASAATRQPGLVTRMRLALAGGPAVSTEPCNCPA